MTERLNSWTARLAAIPSLSLGHLPTPLEPAERLRAALGDAQASVPGLWIKRDDEIGLAIGGNKVRKLAYLLADAQARGARKVVSFGGLQSNFLRTMTSACARLGLEAHCLYFEHPPTRMSGNLLLVQLMGGRPHFVPLGGNAGPRQLRITNLLVRLVAGLLPGIGWRGVYFIPVGGHSPLGCVSYVPTAREIVEQAAAAGFRPTHVVAAAGSGGTVAGLLAGFRLLRVPIQVVGVDVGNLWRGFRQDILHMAEAVTTLLGSPEKFSPGDLTLHPGYGPGYARPHRPAEEAIELVARSEGLLLDPVYTGKAMAGLLDLIRSGHFRPTDQVVFVHTGGVPALFAGQGLLSSPHDTS